MNDPERDPIDFGVAHPPSALEPQSIVHVLTSLHIGGAERVALELIRYQMAQGHRVRLVSLASAPDGPLWAQGKALLGVEPVRIEKAPGFDPTLTRRLSAYFRQEKVTIVHTHNALPLIYGALAGRLAGALVVHTKHGEDPDGGHRQTLRRLAARFTHAFIAVSEPTAHNARRLREVDEAKLVVIRNGVDLSRFGPDPQARIRLRAQWGIPDEARIVGSVGRLSYEKGHDILLRAAAPVLLQHGAWLVLVGGGAERASLQALCQQHEISHRVLFLGEQHEVPSILSALDAFVLSSRTEGLPLVLAEAMATALPVVATAVGGVPACVVHGKTGWLVAAGDEQGLQARLAQLLIDVPGARQLGLEGRRQALALYSCERMGSETLALYQALLRGRMPADLPPGRASHPIYDAHRQPFGSASASAVSLGSRSVGQSSVPPTRDSMF